MFAEEFIFCRELPGKLQQQIGLCDEKEETQKGQENQGFLDGTAYFWNISSGVAYIHLYIL